MTPDECWLATMWPKVRVHLPPPPASVVEIGCGPLGGFVPALEDSGYEAVGIDPEAPEGPSYRRVELERSDLPRQIDAAVASTSLHHVQDPGTVLDAVLDRMSPDGVVVVIEWDWQRFDEATASWCFERLGPPESGGWLRHHQEEWAASGESWDEYLAGWVSREGLHGPQVLLDALRGRLTERQCRYGPYFFPDLADTTESDEQRAIDMGVIQPNRIDFVGNPRR
jgi:SAM-dependent methyltransferase